MVVVKLAILALAKSTENCFLALWMPKRLSTLVGSDGAVLDWA
jgi:hypothetical protein